MSSRFQGGGFFSGGRDFLGGSFLLDDAHPVGIHIVHGFDFTETNTLRVSVTEIALKNLSIHDVKIHCAEGADRHAGTATNADIMVHHYPAILVITGNSLHGANDLTGSILTLLTGHGNVKPFCLPLHNLYTASCCIGYAVMENRADELTEPAPGALFVIDCENFTHGFH